MPPKSKPHTATPVSSTTIVQRVVQISFHLASLAIFQFAFHSLPYVANISGLDIEAMFGGHYQFLTVLGLWTSRLAIVLALLNDVLAPFEPLQRAKTLASAVALPTESVISLLYWTILAIDPELLMPPKKVVDPGNPAQFVMETVRLPFAIDFSMHAAPAVVLLVDYLLFSPPYPKTARPMLTSALTVVGYGSWCEVCKTKNGHYPYPLLGVLSAPYRIALYAACAAIFIGVIKAVDGIHYALDKVLNRQWTFTEPIKKTARQKK